MAQQKNKKAKKKNVFLFGPGYLKKEETLIATIWGENNTKGHKDVSQAKRYFKKLFLPFPSPGTKSSPRVMPEKPSPFSLFCSY